MKKRKASTILRRIIVPLLILSVLQAVILSGLLVLDGVFETVRVNALEMLTERVQNKHQSLQAEMTTSWINLSATQDSVNKIVESVLKDTDSTYSDIATDAKLNAQIVSDCADELIKRMRNNGTTGIFLILDGDAIADQPETYAGVYIRDTDPTSETSDDSDLYMLRCLPPLSRALEISLDSFWKSCFTFEGGTDNSANDYFFKPLNAAKANTSSKAKSTHFGYWSRPHAISGKDDLSVLTYSLPMIAADGTTYGVLGVEINASYLVSVLNDGEFARSSRGCYFLGVTTDGGQTYEHVATGGAKFKQYFSAEDLTLHAETVDDGLITVQSTRTDETVYGSVFKLELYSPNTPFINDQWVLIGLQDESTLLSFFNRFQELVYIAIGVSLVLSVAASLLIGSQVAQPITRLARQLEESDANSTLKLDETGITEVDTLANAVVSLNHDVAESASRISKIIRLSGLPIGVFELKADRAFCSDGFFELMQCEQYREAGNYMDVATCRKLVGELTAHPTEADVYEKHDGDDVRYLRVKRQKDGDTVIGTVIDVTEEIENRRRIEHERDYDLLTGILNRRAFERRAQAMIDEGDVGVSALMMMDLDNLKFLNDAYGHDCGDKYIRTFAGALSALGSEHTVVARRSGDEFYVFFHHFADKAEIRELIRCEWEKMVGQKMLLPDGTEYRIRASGGVAWYPDDADTLMTLIHYADFAMYKIKHSSKGSFEEFNHHEYSEDSFLFSARAALDRLIDNGLVRFMYQPIIEVATAKTYGYELLMRTTVEELPDPGSVLRLAKEQGKLQHIERLTWFKGLESVSGMRRIHAVPEDAKFFINSIANQVMSASEEEEIDRLYGEMLEHLVIEVTEGEDNKMVFTQQKLGFARAHHAMVAIDDYGTGYNSELALMKIQANIVKIDISFVRNVDSDQGKQTLIRNLISYARQQKIAVLAEGVETEAEMRTLIGFGVDYLQGYYLGRPQYEPALLSEDKAAQIRCLSAKR